MTPSPLRVAALLAGLLVALVPATLASGAPVPSARPPAAAAAAAATAPATTAAGSGVVADQRLTVGLDGVVALSPEDTCLVVAVDGEVVYRHAADRSMVPASTLKLFTATAALDRLGPDHRFRTVVAAPAAPAGGVVAGDLTLVGGGDPLLTTDAYRFVRRLGDDQPLTSLDRLADQVRASGVTHVTGRVVGDESRYDAQRWVPSWPERYQREQQIGPLSALDVDDGFVLRLPAPGDDAPPRREVSGAPALDAARVFTELLRARGVRVDGEPAVGTAPPGAAEVTAIESAPLSAIVGHMLQHSDNGTAELLTKELGHAGSGGGTTTAGTFATAARLDEMGIPLDGVEFHDGSGLDPANHVTCEALVAVLDRSGGIDGPIGAGLPVAAESGTLEKRFRGSAAAGRLRAKTGSLNRVTSLAGFVALPEGGTATFAYVANGPRTEDVYRGQEFLGDLLGQYVVPCLAPAQAAVVAPVAPYLVSPGLLSAAPLGAVLLPAVALPVAAFGANGADLVSTCVAASEGFRLVLR